MQLKENNTVFDTEYELIELIKKYNGVTKKFLIKSKLANSSININSTLQKLRAKNVLFCKKNGTKWLWFKTKEN